MNMLKSTQNLGMESGILLHISTSQEHQLIKFKSYEFPEIVTETGLQIRVRTGKLFSYFSTKTYVGGTQKKTSQ